MICAIISVNISCEEICRQPTKNSAIISVVEDILSERKDLVDDKR